MNNHFTPAVPELSVIVVAADSGADLRDCVRQVLALDTPLELILVDNASTDGVPQALARANEYEPRFRLLQNHRNLGFGPAVNRAAEQAKARQLLVLNPDCEIDQASLDRLLAAFGSEPRVGLLGAVVCDAAGRPDPASWRRDPLLHRALATLFDGKGERVEVNEAVPERVFEVEAISGALMLLPRNLFQRLGGFDEGYFLHCEDLDLCRRVRDVGWRVLLAGDVRVVHRKGGSGRHRPVFVSRHKHGGMWRWFRKFDPAAHRPLVAMAVWLGIWGHFLFKVPGLLLHRQVAGK